MNKKDNGNDSKKIIATLVMVFTLMFCTTSATYAYLAFSATNNAMTGQIAASGLTLTVTPQTLGGTKSGTVGTVMVPQLETALGKAMGTDYKCVDNKGNIVCKVYKITVSTTSTATTPTTGTISFAGIAKMPNLKWRLATDATTLGSTGTTTAATTSAAQFAEPEFSATNQSFTYYIVVWINAATDASGKEIAQTDSGTWRATIAFNNVNGGITSTIRG